MIYNPLRRESMRFLETAAGTRGHRLRVAVSTKEIGAPPLLHYHPEQDETVVVRAGRLGCVLGDRERFVEAGSTIRFQRRVPHTWWNDGPSALEVEVTFEPAGAMQELLESHYGLVREGKVNAQGVPRPLQAAVVAWHFRRTWVPARIPAPLRVVAIPVLAAIGRMRGLRAWSPAYAAGPSG